MSHAQALAKSGIAADPGIPGRRAGLVVDQDRQDPPCGLAVSKARGRIGGFRRKSALESPGPGRHHPARVGIQGRPRMAAGRDPL